MVGHMCKRLTKRKIGELQSISTNEYESEIPVDVDIHEKPRKRMVKELQGAHKQDFQIPTAVHGVSRRITRSMVKVNLAIGARNDKDFLVAAINEQERVRVRVIEPMKEVEGRSNFPNKTNFRRTKETARRRKSRAGSLKEENRFAKISISGNASVCCQRSNGERTKSNKKASGGKCQHESRDNKKLSAQGLITASSAEKSITVKVHRDEHNIIHDNKKSDKKTTQKCFQNIESKRLTRKVKYQVLKCRIPRLITNKPHLIFQKQMRGRKKYLQGKLHIITEVLTVPTVVK